MSKIMVTGATGLLGRAVVSKLMALGHQVIACGFSRARNNPQAEHESPLHKLDLTQASAVARFIEQQLPEVIVHCAAERRPDVSEQNPDAALALNLDASQALASAAKHHNAWLIYISTDYVFDGTAPPYRESDSTHPVNFYGQSKRQGEQAILDISESFAVLRLPILYGDVERLEESAVLILLKQLLNHQRQEVDDWAARRPTSTRDVAKAIAQMIERQQSMLGVQNGQALAGIYHFSAEQTFTKYQMLVRLGQLLGISHQHLQPNATPTDCAKRPQDCTLSCERLGELGIVSTMTFDDGVVNALVASRVALGQASPHLVAALDKLL